MTDERNAAQAQLAGAEKTIGDLKHALQVASATAKLGLPADNIERAASAPDQNAALNRVSPLHRHLQNPVRRFRGFNTGFSWEDPF
jgi:hypothetical protein